MALVEVLQPAAVPVDVEDMGLVEEAVQDRRGNDRVAEDLNWPKLQLAVKMNAPF